MAVREAAVAVINKNRKSQRKLFTSLNLSLDVRGYVPLLGIILLSLFCGTLQSAVLPEQRIDLMYHGYDGDQTTVDGPKVLVRKNFAEKISISGHYQEDLVSSASVDVRANASRFVEKRKEYGMGVDYLQNKTIISLGYNNSDSGDYVADTFSLGASHDFFGDLTSVSVNIGISKDEVFNATDDSFADTVDTQSYSLAISQILTKNLVVGLTAHTISSEGYLQSPYRSIRFIDSVSADGIITVGSGGENYPRTRNSDALALRANYYLPYRASLRGEYRAFSDSWGIRSDTMRVDYIQPFKDFTFSLNYRAYDQTGADFYSDLFAFPDSSNFQARDKELGDMESVSYGIAVDYTLPTQLTPKLFNKASINIAWDFFEYDYLSFRDVTARDSNGASFQPGTEPFFSYDGTAARVFLSFWY